MPARKNLIAPPRVTVIRDDGTEVEVKFTLGLNIDLSGLGLDDREGDGDSRTTLAEKKL